MCVCVFACVSVCMCLCLDVYCVFACVCWYVYLPMCVCLCVCLHVFGCMWRPEVHIRHFLSCSIFLKQRLPVISEMINSGILASSLSGEIPGNPLSLLSMLLITRNQYTFYVGAGILNPHPHVCIANVSFTE